MYAGILSAPNTGIFGFHISYFKSIRVSECHPSNNKECSTYLDNNFYICIIAFFLSRIQIGRGCMLLLQFSDYTMPSLYCSIWLRLKSCRANFLYPKFVCQFSIRLLNRRSWSMVILWTFSVLSPNLCNFFSNDGVCQYCFWPSRFSVYFGDLIAFFWKGKRPTVSICAREENEL